MTRGSLSLLGTLLLSTGCGGMDLAEVDAADALVTTPLTPQEERGVLALVNDCAVDVTTLDVDADLDRRAASNIVDHRDGADGRCNSADDDRFDGLPELDAIPYVGDAALARLLAYATDHGYLPAVDGAIYVEGVAFSTAEAAAVLELCNCAALAVLDDAVGLDARAAAAIVAARPFADPDPAVAMARLAAVSYVGSSALAKLKAFAPGWTGSCAPQGGTFDGVLFSDAQGQLALAVINSASRGQLRADAGFSKQITDLVVTGRPWAGLQPFAAASGIGAATLTRLRDFVDSGLWRGPGLIQTALTVADVVARAAALSGQFVSFNRVLATDAHGGGIFEATIRDAASGASSARLYRNLCNPISESCEPAPAIAAGEEFELVHLRVDFYDGRLTLNLVDTTEVRALGCWEGWSRSCGVNVGVCTVGSESCTGDRWSRCSGLVEQLASDPADGLDNDCDGQVDENSVALRALAQLADPVRALGLSGDRSIAGNGQEMLRLDLSDPARPAVVGRASQVDLGKPKLRADAARAVMAVCRSGTRLYDLAVPGLVPALSLPLTLTAATVGCIRDALQVGDRLYTADDYNGVFGYDLSGGAPQQVLHIALQRPRAIEVRGHHLIVLADQLWVYDLEAPTAPVQGPFHGGSDLAINASGLIAVADSSGVHLFDAADPARLRPFPVVAVAAAALDLDGDLLIIAPPTGDRVLKLLQVVDPAAPRLVAEVAVPNPNGVLFGSAFDGVQLDGSVIYAYGGSGLHIFSIGAP